jgi:hypothetical protein
MNETRFRASWKLGRLLPKPGRGGSKGRGALLKPLLEKLGLEAKAALRRQRIGADACGGARAMTARGGTPRNKGATIMTERMAGIEPTTGSNEERWYDSWDEYQRDRQRQQAELIAAPDAFPCPRCNGTGNYCMVVEGGYGETCSSCPPCMSTGRTTPKIWNEWCEHFNRK